MLVLSTLTDQTLSTNESIVFDKQILHTGCAECHRNGATSIKLKTGSIYEISFNANVSSSGSTANPVYLALQLGDETILPTYMTATSTTFITVGFTILQGVTCCDLNRIKITNVGTNDVVVDANVNLSIRRVS